jgi:hypothetical protein
MVSLRVPGSEGRPTVIVVRSHEEVERVVKALLMLGEYEGVLAEAPNGWMVIPATNGTLVSPRSDK